MSGVAPLKKTGQTASDDQTTQAGIRGTVYVSCPGSYFKFVVVTGELLPHIITYIPLSTSTLE